MEHIDYGRIGLDAAYQYADDVRSNLIPVCRLTRLAIDRWYRDLETAGERGLYFDENAAARPFRFTNLCRHYQGKWAGQPITFEPWQCFQIANVYGWKRADGTRRFRIVYEEVPRKNGKTTKLAVIGTYGLVADDEQGPKIYAAATKREQAMELWNSARAMVLQSPPLKKRVIPYRVALVNESNFGTFLPLAADSKSMDGLNVHYGLVDELHAHPDSRVWDVIKSARGARTQALLWAITTAGFNRDSICYELRNYAIQVLEQAVDDDAFFAVIYTIDHPEKWDDETEWRKANPNYGVSVNPDDMRDQARLARSMPSELVEFLTKRLNIWVYGESKFMNMDRWNACQADFDELAAWNDDLDIPCELDGEEAFGGLDLASVEDMCAFGLLFRMPNGKRRLYLRAYLPDAALERRFKSGDRTLEQFKRVGALVVTPGEVTDYEWIKKDIRTAHRRFVLKGIAFDRFNSSQLVNDLIAEDVPMVQFGQGYASMNPAMKEFQRLTLTEQFEHNNPTLSWAVSNLIAERNPAGDIKPAKNKVKEKIDPAVAVIMCVGLSMPQDEETDISAFFNNPVI